MSYISKRIFLITLFFLLPLEVFAGDFRGEHSTRSYGRLNIYNYDGNRRDIHHTGPIFSPDGPSNGCFPYGCGDITGPFKNPDPNARKPENLTVCIYGVTGILLYERKNKVCSYKYIDKNQIGIEQRRQEWLKR